ncbi:hypothetical protein CGCSCA4_v014642 [Colletotrichum siamense]|uniref:Uncharacterized protein n=1 Tax=Colletotrichum siamense TaxID=690259 RepID=A0A9P5BLA9_COLSI|nr:hypothetical protein CGCSCA4_v014642 [Colletotrichum siamense]KAF4842312.1 hypothetical protein CGCSCA2_v014621 [Colletotrichum siamense]
MAGAGFRYTGERRHQADSVTCDFCEMQAWAWEAKDDPFEEHQTGSPNCQYLTTQLFKDRHKVFLLKREATDKASPAASNTVDEILTPPVTPVKPKTGRKPGRKSARSMVLSPNVTVYDSSPANEQTQDAVHQDTGKQPVEITITAGSTKITIQVTDVSPRGTLICHVTHSARH